MNNNNVYFRAGVGIILYREGRVALFERSDLPGAWQFPQGGIHPGESPVETMWRELYEETGIQERDCLLAYQVPLIVSYTYPHETNKKSSKTEYIGQSQFWFFVELLPNVSIDLSQASDKEFIQQQWLEPHQALSQIIEWKRESCKQIIDYFYEYTNK